MAKLYRVNYLQDNDSGTYLTIGSDDDTEDTVTARELESFGDKSCLYSFHATEVKEVKGHKIICTLASNTDSETLQEFIQSVLNETQEGEKASMGNLGYFGELCRMCEDSPFWALFIGHKGKGGAISIGGHYPLAITSMDDFTKVLDIIAANNMKLKVDTKEFFACSTKA